MRGLLRGLARGVGVRAGLQRARLWFLRPGSRVEARAYHSRVSRTKKANILKVRAEPSRLRSLLSKLLLKREPIPHKVIKVGDGSTFNCKHDAIASGAMLRKHERGCASRAGRGVRRIDENETTA